SRIAGGPPSGRTALSGAGVSRSGDDSVSATSSETRSGTPNNSVWTGSGSATSAAARLLLRGLGGLEGDSAARSVARDSSASGSVISATVGGGRERDDCSRVIPRLSRPARGSRDGRGGADGEALGAA